MTARTGTLRRSDLDPDPVEQFRRWYAHAEGSVDMPEAVALASAHPGHPYWQNDSTP